MHEHEYVSEEMLCVLAQVAGEDNVLMTEPMREHTTFKIGGPADVLVTPRTADALVRVLDTCYAGGVPVTIVGTAPICWWATRRHPRRRRIAARQLCGHRSGCIALARDGRGGSVAARRGAHRPLTRASPAWSRCGASPPPWAAPAS